MRILAPLFCFALAIHAEDTKQVPLKVLDAQEQASLLSRRLNGSLGESFGAFANMFMVRSQMDLRVCVGLKGATDEITKTELQPVFPAFYKPNLKELLDAIALQTFSNWSYRKEDQFVTSTVPDAKADDHVVIISFDPVKPPLRKVKPFTVELAKDWKAEDRGHWLACIPPTFPAGMDVYQLGTYSTTKKDGNSKLITKVRQEVALEWARRVKPDATAAELQPAKVGDFDALHFDAMVPSRGSKEVRWRHWVFMMDNACYFIVSTIFPEMEEELFPDVKQMIGSFKPVK